VYSRGGKELWNSGWNRCCVEGEEPDNNIVLHAVIENRKLTVVRWVELIGDISDPIGMFVTGRSKRRNIMI